MSDDGISLRIAERSDQVQPHGRSGHGLAEVRSLFSRDSRIFLWLQYHTTLSASKASITPSQSDYRLIETCILLTPSSQVHEERLPRPLVELGGHADRPQRVAAVQHGPKLGHVVLNRENLSYFRPPPP